MGAKGAASYFQKQMSVEVLPGLLYNICEVYIDDLIIYARTEEEMSDRLRAIFERLRQWNVKVHPKKVKLGLQSVEYVGHVITPDGLQMSLQKVQKIMNFARPQDTKGIQQFLGMVGWFKDHIPEYSTMSRGLRDMVQSGDKPHTTRVWTERAIASFEDIRTAINKCPKLFFTDDGDEVHIETDASMSGIGAILYVIRQGKNYPIQWYSESFTKQQRNWKTQEQECYAIIASIKHFHQYISHINFTVHTDHKALLALNDSNPKVVRWKVELSHYNINWSFIQGKLNVVADALSRLKVIEENGGWFLQTEGSPMLEADGYAEDETVPTSHDPIPKEVQYLLHKCHNRKVGHVGVDKTLRRLNEHPNKVKVAEYSQHQLKDWTIQFTRQCRECQMMSVLKPKIETFKFNLAGHKPFVRINFDTIGPLPEDLNKFKYVLVISDTFSRYVKIRPLLDTKGLNAVMHLKEYINTYGVPAEMLSDNGTQFVNEVLTAYSQMVGSEKLETLAYSHQENGLVERTNRDFPEGRKSYFRHNKFTDLLDFAVLECV